MNRSAPQPTPASADSFCGRNENRASRFEPLFQPLRSGAGNRFDRRLLLNDKSPHVGRRKRNGRTNRPFKNLYAREKSNANGKFNELSRQTAAPSRKISELSDAKKFTDELLGKFPTVPEVISTFIDFEYSDQSHAKNGKPERRKT